MHPLISKALHEGPASDLYAALVPDQPLSRGWLHEIREAWGRPDHPSLALFADVDERSLKLASLEFGVSVKVQVFTPSTSTCGALLYLHGGGWIAPMSGKHLGWAKRIAALSERTVYAVDYRLAPEHPYPAAFQDCIGVLKHVFKTHQNNVAIAGDSAGANLAAACDQWQLQQQARRPDGMVLICGVLDLELERHQSMIEFGIGHPYNGIELLAYQRALYAPRVDQWSQPLTSPAHGDLSTLPPTLVIVGEHDPLRDDGLDFATKANSQGSRVKVHIGSGMPHGFVMQHSLVGEAAAAAEEQILAFLHAGKTPQRSKR
ncbi:alpha/beta hydrolase fold family protein [Synechococcus sp. BIOS-E4-1]|uniref:alpha/beta hydrolase n=1 Tax=Synechococcus sp. BIOS-E4-1 TaxID=1400864 RepID=UPI0016462644|nr:alpha/beta hydrolase [Synechococcus sp. BIOS-E4-1]QNI55615.1 alpha/beta hydrolase fold family protein [Synechococcus sp. BIOS-E4-1]